MSGMSEQEQLNWMRSNTVKYISVMRDVMNYFVSDTSSNNPAEQLESQIKTYTYWLQQYVMQDARHLGKELVMEYIENYVLLLENFDSMHNTSFVVDAIDCVITYFLDAGESVVDFYILKIRYIGGLDVENRYVEHMLLEYIAQSRIYTEDYFRLRLRLAQYYTDISEYDKCLAECREIKQQMSGCQLPSVYDIEWYTIIGVCYATTYRDDDLAEKHLLHAVQLSKTIQVLNKRVIRLLSTVFHYLGRVYEYRQQFKESMKYFSLGGKYQFHGNLETVSEGFFHLRLAESLTSIKLYAQAYDHLQMSDSMFGVSNNRSSGWTQLQVANATFEMAQGHYADAELILKKTLHASRISQFIRGQLVCLGYLLTLQLKRGYIWKVPSTLLSILKTAINGELRRNNIIKLFANLPRLIKFLFMRISGPTSKSSKEEVSCMCPLHVLKPVSESQIKNSNQSRIQATVIRMSYCDQVFTHETMNVGK